MGLILTGECAIKIITGDADKISASPVVVSDKNTFYAIKISVIPGKSLVFHACMKKQDFLTPTPYLSV